MGNACAGLACAELSRLNYRPLQCHLSIKSLTAIRVDEGAGADPDSLDPGPPDPPDVPGPPAPGPPAPGSSRVDDVAIGAPCAWFSPAMASMLSDEAAPWAALGCCGGGTPELGDVPNGVCDADPPPYGVWVPV